jgi:hypothetical protein
LHAAAPGSLPPSLRLHAVSLGAGIRYRAKDPREREKERERSENGQPAFYGDDAVAESV